MADYTEKQSLRLWSDYLESIKNSIAAISNETAAAQRKRIAYLEAHPENWFAHYFPNFCTATPAPFHKAATRRVLSHPEYYEVRMWSRELAKSTRTMMEVLYLMLTKKKKYCMLASSSIDSAERLLEPYRGQLEANPRIIQDYGAQVTPGKWTATEFRSVMGFAFRGIGSGQQPRGSRMDEVRPDIILVDDIDTDADCRNPEMVKKTWDWIDQALIGTRSISNPLLVIFCGNKIAKDCCVERATQFADHVSIVNIRDENGISTWPQKNTEEHIDRVLAKRSYAATQKEYFNNPIIEGSVFNNMAYKPARRITDYSTLVCYTDPSFKDGKKNDYKATVLVGFYQGEFHVIKAFVEQTTTAKMIDWHYEVMDIVGQRSCYYLMEQVFLSELIIKEVYEAAKTKGRTIPLSGDTRTKDQKFTRIETLLEPLHRNGKLFFNEYERENPHMVRLIEQFVALSPTSRAHDDGPDAVEGAVWVINAKEAVALNGAATVINAKRNSKRF